MLIPLLSRNIGDNQVFIALHPSKTPFLNQFKGILVNNSVLIRSEYIDSQEKCRELLELGQQISRQISEKEIRKPFRVVSIQLTFVANEWDLVQKQHRKLLKFAADHFTEFQVAHLCFPIELEDPQLKTETFFDSNKKIISQLLKQFNAEAWLMYCSWFNQECEQAVQAFHTEDSEEYQLQALFEDFSHEARSSLLFDRQQNIIRIMIEEENAVEAGDNEQLLALEKQVVFIRMQLLSDLQTQSHLLTLIVEGIQKIEAMHPELAPLKRMAILLNQVIQNHFSADRDVWSREKQILAMQLLDEQLDVLPMISCGLGVEQADSLLSMRLALAEMKKNYSFDVLLNMCLEWDQKHEKESNIKHLRQLMLYNLDLLKS